MKIILASNSPRRKEILELMGYSFTVAPSNADEKISSYKSYQDYAMQLAMLKGQSINKVYKDDIVLGFDTIVVCDNEIMGKPKSKEEAFEMISKLSNNRHIVITGVYVSYQEKEILTYEETLVFVDEISDQEINDYVSTNEPYDKAGGYAIQGIFGKYISKINGDFYNVVGLPINKVRKIINEIR